MTERNNWIKLFSILFISITISYLFTTSSLVDLVAIKNLSNDLHYNLISTAATIGGFLFTGVTILISAISNERVERLWENDYLNNLYRAAFVGILANVATILSALASLFLLLSEKWSLHMIQVEIITILVGIVFFVWSGCDLVFILSKMRKQSTKGPMTLLPF